MKNLNKLSLSDLINGITYLDDVAKRIEQYIIGIEKENKKEADLMKNKWSSIRRKVMKFRKEIQRRLLDDNEIKLIKNIDDRTDGQIVRDLINEAIRLKDIPKGENKFTKKAYRKLKDRSFIVKLLDEIKKELGKENSNNENILNTLQENYIYRLTQLTRNDSKPKKQIKTIPLDSKSKSIADSSTNKDEE